MQIFSSDFARNDLYNNWLSALIFDLLPGVLHFIKGPRCVHTHSEVLKLICLYCSSSAFREINPTDTSCLLDDRSSNHNRYALLFFGFNLKEIIIHLRLDSLWISNYWFWMMHRILHELFPTMDMWRQPQKRSDSSKPHNRCFHKFDNYCLRVSRN